MADANSDIIEKAIVATGGFGKHQKCDFKLFFPKKCLLDEY